MREGQPWLRRVDCIADCNPKPEPGIERGLDLCLTHTNVFLHPFAATELPRGTADGS